MTAPFVHLELSRPLEVEESEWISSYLDEQIPSLISHGVVRNGALYRLIPNPMGRVPPDDKTFLVFYQTDFARCLNSENHTAWKRVTSNALRNPKALTTTVHPDVRNYTLVEVFDPKGVGSELPPASFMLVAEAAPVNEEEFHRFYREDHAIMMAKHAGYRRTLHYRIGDLDGGQLEAPDPILVIHEFDSFEEFGGPITQATLVTEFARRVLPKVPMKARTMQLVSHNPETAGLL
ncbi:hypothetical protein FE257_001704 [Aspergillus nanangensis]|uniref:EthD domain-containing protein n=1 Tax=Aspergillus nanangensis TaxID=2582783 RepID=A0AAD4GPJ7_ASPNN|nr:hypothetical protein FE257_001704 [Aspergillus nanangensis]